MSPTLCLAPRASPSRLRSTGAVRPLRPRPLRAWPRRPPPTPFLMRAPPLTRHPTSACCWGSPRARRGPLAPAACPWLAQPRATRATTKMGQPARRAALAATARAAWGLPSTPAPRAPGLRAARRRAPQPAAPRARWATASRRAAPLPRQTRARRASTAPRCLPTRRSFLAPRATSAPQQRALPRRTRAPRAPFRSAARASLAPPPAGRATRGTARQPRAPLPLRILATRERTAFRAQRPPSGSHAPRATFARRARVTLPRPPARREPTVRAAPRRKRRAWRAVRATALRRAARRPHRTRAPRATTVPPLQPRCHAPRASSAPR